MKRMRGGCRVCLPAAALFAAVALVAVGCTGGPTSGLQPSQPITTASSCTSVALPSGSLTEDNQTDATIDVFGQANVPVASLTGPATTIGYPFGIAYQSDGLMYVANNAPAAILEFAAGSNGNCAPTRSIQGPDTQLGTSISVGTPTPLIAGIAFDSSGDLFVAATQGNAILVFAPGASGDAAPIRSIRGPTTTLNGPRQIAFDSGGNLWVANRTGNSVIAFAPGASGDAPPIVTIGGPSTGVNQPWGVTFDRDGCLWVANATPTDTMVVFMPPFGGNQTPSHIIAGASTGLANPYGETVDGSGNVVVANLRGNTVEVFADSAAGNASPLRTLANLSGPTFVTYRP